MAMPRARRPAPPDPRDLSGDFAHCREVEVRFGDTDAMGHVNNAAYLTYCEIARMAYYEDVTGQPLPLGVHGAEEGMILADIHLAYRSPTVHGEVLAVETRVTGIGRTSFSMEHRITAPDSRCGKARLVAVADSVLVTYDYRADRAIPVPGWMRQRIAEFEGLPEGERAS